MSINTRLKHWLPTLIWMGTIFWLSSRPAITTSSVDWQDFLFKKIGHFIEYGLLAVLIYRSLAATTNYSRLKLIIYTCLIAVSYAITDEIHQSFIPGREPRVRDVAIDTSGVIVALALRP